jgi:hypothetical protein
MESAGKVTPPERPPEGKISTRDDETREKTSQVGKNILSQQPLAETFVGKILAEEETPESLTKKFTEFLEKKDCKNVEKTLIKMPHDLKQTLSEKYMQFLYKEGKLQEIERFIQIPSSLQPFCKGVYALLLMWDDKFEKAKPFLDELVALRDENRLEKSVSEGVTELEEVYKRHSSQT